MQRADVVVATLGKMKIQPYSKPEDDRNDITFLSTRNHALPRAQELEWLCTGTCGIVHNVMLLLCNKATSCVLIRDVFCRYSSFQCNSTGLSINP